MNRFVAINEFNTSELFETNAKLQQIFNQLSEIQKQLYQCNQLVVSWQKVYFEFSHSRMKY